MGTGTDLPRLYSTRLGSAIVGDSLNLLDALPAESVDLVLTSPPFALQRQKDYGNQPQEKYVDWLLQFAARVHRVLKDTGSFVLDLGGAYEKGRPVRSLYSYRVLIRLCDELGFHLAQEFFWHNPSRLPSPAEWVTVRRIRVKDSVDTIWWLSKSPTPKANNWRVLQPYSSSMRSLLEKGYRAKKRPSGHDISENFSRDNGGAIPPNLLEIPNTESNSQYLRHCAAMITKPHPARFPLQLPSFFIKFLTDPGDLVLDIFAGSNTTGEAAEKLRRRWLAFELDHHYLATSAFRFLNDVDEVSLCILYGHLIGSPAANLTLDD